MTVVDPVALALVLVANGAPLLVGLVFGDRLAMPLDGGRRLADGRPVLGPHKTWRGIIAATLATAAAGMLLGTGAAVGAAAGLLAMCGDLLSSFAKRRLGHAPGRERLLLDPLPECLLPLAVLAPALGLGPLAIVGTTLVFAVIDVLVSRALR
jgi:CDP-2,3-bis-(O-geranylgeranyl)-sn-glycerol synthase